MGNKKTETAELREELAELREEFETLEPLSERTEQAEAEFTRFFDQSLDLLCIAAVDGYFRRLNPAWTTTLGWTLEELLARPFVDFVHPDDRKDTRAEIEKLDEGAEAILFENRYRHRDGSYRWLRWNARPELGSGRIYATARDVTRHKRLEREILEILDRERERLGRELHDGLCQNLAGIAALSTTLAKKLAASSEDAGSDAARTITRLLSETIGETRDLARGLGPVGLETDGLDAALAALALSVQHRFGVTCSFSCGRPLSGPCLEVQSHLFRIAQEAVRNALTHGKADRIDISLSSEDDQGLVRVRDNGVGITLHDAPDLAGVGLHTMAYRARLIGRSLEVRRRESRGTAVTCVFPLRETPETRETPEGPEQSSDD